MSSQIRQASNQLDTSLNFKREFTNIHLIRHPAKKDDNLVHLKLQSKIIQPSKTQQSLNSKSKQQLSTLRSNSKSQAVLKSKIKNDTKQSTSALKNNTHQKQCKTINNKYNQSKTKCKINSLNKNTTKTTPTKPKDKKKILQKDNSIINCLKQLIVPTKTNKLRSVKSDIKIRMLKTSDLRKSPKLVSNFSKIHQQYFGGSEHQLPNYDKKKVSKQMKDKSKCRTDHSDNSSKTKQHIKFHKTKPR